MPHLCHTGEHKALQSHSAPYPATFYCSSKVLPPVKKPPALRKNNSAIQVRFRLDGQDRFVNRIGRWDDPIAHAKANAIAAQIWSDYQQGILDASLLSYQPAVKDKEVGLLDALKQKAAHNRQSSSIHAYRVLQSYGRPLKRRSDV